MILQYKLGSFFNSESQFKNNLFQHFRRGLRVVTPQQISIIFGPISSQYIIRKSQPHGLFG